MTLAPLSPGVVVAAFLSAATSVPATPSATRPPPRPGRRHAKPAPIEGEASSSMSTARHTHPGHLPAEPTTCAPEQEHFAINGWLCSHAPSHRTKDGNRIG